jgi:ClpP class serine protease
VDDKTLLLADVGRKAIAQVKQAAQHLLERRLPTEQAASLAETLSSGKWTHDYPIGPEEARSLGLTISTDIPDQVLELMALYPQPVRSQAGGVEYLPIPREKPASA